MKKPFKINVRARTADEAFKQSRAPGKTGFRLVEDTEAQVRAAIVGKLRRVEENAGLYPDKVLEYRQILAKFDAANARDEAVVQAMLEHGDLRTDNATFCAVRRMGPDRWVVFGYDFT